jgi:hypothetical protein
VTLGFMSHLTFTQAEAIKKQFNNQKKTFHVDGYGVIDNQVAYLHADGQQLVDARQQLKTLSLEEGFTYGADDFHVTIGFNPSKPKDIHDVPKPAMFKFDKHQVITATLRLSIDKLLK